MATPNLTEAVTKTLRNRSKTLADNVSKGNALLSRLNSRGKIRTVSGGREILQELEHAENSSFLYYSGYEVLDITPAEVFSSAVFQWKQAAVAVSWSGLEADIQNTGKEQIMNLVESRIANAMRTMRNNLSTGIYSDGSGTAGKQVGGLQLLVADAPATGTVGGINRANHSFWRNQYYDFSSASVAASSTTIQAAMRALWIDCKRGSDHVDMWIGGDTYFEYFWNSLTTIQRIERTDQGKAGFRNLMFVDADVFHDGDSGLAATRMYALNTDFLYWRPHANRNITTLDRRGSVNQDAGVVPIVWAGNLTVSNASLQGVMTA